MKIAKPIAALIESFEKLPGIGPKTAQRLTFYLLHNPQRELDVFAESLSRVKKDTVLCRVCRNISEDDPCPICSDSGRDAKTILVVEQPLDILAFEKTGKFQGVYHVLHGSISPLENIGPDEIYIKQLLDRISGDQHSAIREIILATNPTMEGEATAMYISKQIDNLKNQNPNIKNLRITRLGQGLPTGGDVEYADELTLCRALEGRKDF